MTKVKKSLKRKREPQKETAPVAPVPVPPVRQSDEPVEKKVITCFFFVKKYRSIQ